MMEADESSGQGGNIHGREPRGGASIVAGFLAALILVGIGFFTGFTIAGRVPISIGATSETTAPDIDLAPLYKAWHLLEENFAPAATTTAMVTPEERLYGMIAGLAASYGDDYTVFFPPQEKKLFDTQVSGNFEGVGMEIDVKDGVLTVVAPLKGTPAIRAGVKSGDKILKIDDESTAGITTEEAVKKIRGPRGTTVVILVAREDEAPFEIPLVRDTITLTTVETELRPDGVFVLKLLSFNAISPQKFREGLREFSDSGADKLILDLRGNPGGFLEAAVDIASWFLPVGTPVVLEDSGGRRDDKAYRSYGYVVFTDKLKLAILIDGGSASAAEILAGALRDHGRATLIGTKTFGKGSVQQTFDVTSDTTLKITVARWLTPAKVSISHEGVHPDITVERTDEDIEAERDPQLERAVEFLRTGK
ncbi:MAG: S41 family peptidase [Patescibacteria group bacterium]